MIEVRIANSKDKESWNNVVKNSANGTFFHTWEWLEVIIKGLSERVYPLVVEKNNIIVGIFPAFTRSILNSDRAGSKVRWFDKSFPWLSSRFQILWSPYPNSWGYGGPCIISGIDETTQMLFYNKLYNQMHTLCETEKSIVDLRSSPFNCTSFDTKIMNENKYTYNERRTLLIDLTLNEDVLWRNLRKDSHRNAINQARRKGVNIIEANKKSDFLEFYKLAKDLEIRTGVPADPLIYYMQIYKLLMPEGMAKLFLAERAGIIIGGLVNFYYKDMAFLGHMSFPKEYGVFRGNNLAIWHSIIDSKENGFKYLDLTGLPHDEKNGIYIFKSGFGGTIKNLKWCRKKIRYIKSRETLSKLTQYI